MKAIGERLAESQWMHWQVQAVFDLIVKHLWTVLFALTH